MAKGTITGYLGRCNATVSPSFVRPENNLSFVAVMEVFLAIHLGGQRQEFNDDFCGSVRGASGCKLCRRAMFGHFHIRHAFNDRR